MDAFLLGDLVLALIVSVAILFIFHKFKVPTIVGFLLIGVLAGPKGLGVIKAIHVVEILAEVGVILLLFTIGIEFSLKTFFRIRRAVLIGGSLQILLTTLISFVIAQSIGKNVGESIFLGFLISLSSTAIVLKLMQERAEIKSTHGLVTLGILIFQDVALVPMILIIPILAGKVESLGVSLIFDIAIGLIIIVLIIAGGRWVIPRMLFYVEKTKSRELFLLSTITICFTVAWLTSLCGLSLAIGAFLAGLIISESEHSHSALGNILPFRDVFTGLFFISIGMLLDITYVSEHLGIILLISIGVLILKTIAAGTVTAFLGFPFRTNMLVGLSLSQVGEFSFVLLKAGLAIGLLSNGNIYQVFVAVSVLTMAATPLIINLAPSAVTSASKLPMPKWFKSGLYKSKDVE